MRCLGTTTTTRACHFQNVYYDLDIKHFVYYGPAGTTPELFGAPVESGDPWLRMVRGVSDWREENLRRQQFFMDWQAGRPPPPAARVAEFAQPLHLRCAMNTRSFGHYLRDDLLPMVDLALRFGRQPVDFDWVRWETDIFDFTGWERTTPVMEHYRGLFNGRPSRTWQEVLDEALAGQPPGVRFIRFAEIIAGQGPVDMLTQASTGKAIDEDRLAAWAHMCDPYPFTEMRSIAYRNAGLQVASVSELEPFVLFIDNVPADKRKLANGEALLPSLKAKFPGVRIEYVIISRLTLEEQLQLLAKATVLVSNIGSRSFRLIYLPNGATTILVGPPEFEVTLEPEGGKPEKHQNTTPFFEIDVCWGFIGYVNMLQYHVETAAEVRPSRPWTDERGVRNSDVVLDEDKLTALLEVALQKSAGAGKEPYSGSGALSAYRIPAEV